MRVLLKHSEYLRSGGDNPGGILLQGVVGVHRSKARTLVFTAAIHISYYGGVDECLAGRSLHWTEMSVEPETFGKHLMDQKSMIASFAGVHSADERVQNFLSLLSGSLFDTAIQLGELAAKKRERNANRAVSEMTSLREVVISTGCNLEVAAIEATA